MRSVLSIYFFYFIVVSIVLFGCKKSGSSDITPGTPLDVKVIASLQGRVIDEAGTPVSNATVISGTITTATNINGEFIFNNIQLNKNNGFVIVEKEGYLKGSRTIVTNEGSVNYVQIQLIPKVIKGNFSSASGGQIDIEAGSSVEFTSGSIKNALTNAAYTGTVNVVGAYLDPTDAKLHDKMPGSLKGINTSNEEKILQTFGMLTVELEGSGGEKLQLAPGKTATLTFPIATSMLAFAPASIPLWYFDEATGLWKEEGIANKVGANYVGSVSHFSTWNVDFPSSFVDLKMKLVDLNNNSLHGYEVILINITNNSFGRAFTDNEGNVSILVPLEYPLSLKAINKCGDTIYSNNIGSFNTDTDLEVYNIGDIPICNEGAHHIQASIRQGTVPYTADVLFRANYNSSPGEYINHLVVSFAIDDSLSAGITPLLAPGGEFYSMVFTEAVPFIRIIGDKKVYTWTCTNTTVTDMSWNNNAAFLGLTFVLIGNESRNVRVSLLDLSYSTDNNVNPYYSIGVNTFPYSVFDPKNLFFPLFSVDNNGSAVQKFPNSDQIVTTNLEIPVDVPPQ